MLNRRTFIKSAAVAAAGTSALPAFIGNAMAATTKARHHVVIVGGGYGGATAAKYLRMWGNGAVDVTLIERNTTFVSCPISNLVIGGIKQLEDITVSYENLQSKWGVKLITDEATAIDIDKKTVTTAKHGAIAWDRLVLSPGIDFLPGRIGGLEGNQERIPHAWKAGPQTVALRKQLTDLPDGGTYAISIPKVPYRCPPGPYERACMVAAYFKEAKPRSKVLVLDANAEIQSKKALFERAFAQHYKGILEYKPNAELKEVAGKVAKLEFEDVKADVLNVVPPQRAADLARIAGLVNINNRWVGVNWQTMESTAVPGVHVLGDATFPAPLMPKSGHMANQHAKVAAAAIIQLLKGEAVSATPVVMNTCYSFVTAKDVIHVASVHQYDAADKTFKTVPGSGGVSAGANQIEGRYALSWADNIWHDMLG